MFLRGSTYTLYTPCKWMQHCWLTTPTIGGYYKLRLFAHPVTCCCRLLRFIGSCWAKFETSQTFSHVKTEPTTPNILRPTMLGVVVASVCTLSFKPHIHTKILQTDLLTFPSKISMENLLMDQIMFPLMTISLYLMTFSPDYVLILLSLLLGENRC